VTVILPVRNEARHIGRCLDAVLSQDYAKERTQVLVVDGMSDDGTRETVTTMARDDPRLVLIDNPEHIVSTALNRGIRAAQGDVIIRVDGHTVISRDYVRQCVQVLEASGADNAGGPMHAAGGGYVARGIALATSSPFGVGSARFHYATQPGWVDTVYLGAYRREIFDRVGMFDEELIRNQDDEFNFRLIRAGGKIRLDPSIRSVYYSRSTLRGLWKQYFEYAFWKVRVIQKHKRLASWRHLVPAALVLALGGSLIGGILFGLPILFAMVLFAYLGVSLLVSVAMGARKGWKYIPVLPAAFATLHMAYGIGFLAGIVYFGLSRRPLRNATKNEWTT
jgi:glycosyltransferase involved in cell wall biosynthesis